MPVLHRERLPDGLEIWALSRFEALLLHRELIADTPYHRHGIHIDGSSMVFDIGANIGLYAIAVSKQFPGVRVRCFEPVPVLYDALTRNLSEHVPSATARMVGLSSRPGEATIAFDPYSTVGSSLHPEIFPQGVKPGTSLTTWGRSAMIDRERVEPNLAARVLLAGLSGPWTTPLALAALACWVAPFALRSILFRSRIRVALDTLSSMLRLEDVDGVDLVKIDVEGAEEEVLAGIDDRDWPRLRQFVIEVHDIDGRLDRLDRLLVSRGYRTVRDREPWALHEVLSISTLYAMRDSEFAG